MSRTTGLVGLLEAYSKGEYEGLLLLGGSDGTARFLLRQGSPRRLKLRRTLRRARLTWPSLPECCLLEGRDRLCPVRGVLEVEGRRRRKAMRTTQRLVRLTWPSLPECCLLGREGPAPSGPRSAGEAIPPRNAASQGEGPAPSGPRRSRLFSDPQKKSPLKKSGL